MKSLAIFALKWFVFAAQSNKLTELPGYPREYMKRYPMEAFMTVSLGYEVVYSSVTTYV